MNIYQTEIEQTEIIKKWFTQYGHALVCTVLAILLIVAGYRIWEMHVTKVKTQASEHYQQLMMAVANDDSVRIVAEAEKLNRDYSGTVYSEIAHLSVAKVFVSERKWSKALEQLEQVITQGKNATLKQLARLRTARILLVLNKPEHCKHALLVLKTIDNSTYLPAINEIKGDIYLQLHQIEKARAYYHKAMKAFSKIGLNNPFLEMKLNNISEYQ